MVQREWELVTSGVEKARPLGFDSAHIYKPRFPYYLALLKGRLFCSAAGAEKSLLQRYDVMLRFKVKEGNLDV